MQKKRHKNQKQRNARLRRYMKLAMGDLIRDALHATGIDEEMEHLIANAIIQSWSKNCSKNIINQLSTERKLKEKAKVRDIYVWEAKEPNLMKVRIIAEQLWRRLEQIYEIKLQTWKRNEEKKMEEMMARLRHEYEENFSLKQKQLEELTGRKNDEYKNKEDFLRNDIRMIFEKKKLECERAWREIEIAQKDLRFQNELLYNARENFQSEKDNELYLIEQERCSLKLIKDALKIHEKNLDQKLQEAIRKAREKDRIQIARMISGWNKKEAVLSKKYGMVWNKICEISYEQKFSAEEAVRLKELEEKVVQHQKKLTETKQTLCDALHRQRKTNEDLECIKNEKEKLSETNQKLMERLERRNATVKSLKKQLKLLEESAALRISELKFQHKLDVEKLQAITLELHKYRSNTLEKFHRPNSYPTTITVDSASSSTPTESSSFEQHFHDRMKVLNFTKQELDFEMEKLCVRSHSQPLDYIQSILSNAKISDLEKPVSGNCQESGHETQRFQKDSSITKIDPVHGKMVEMEESAMRTVPNNIEKNVEVEMGNNSSEKHAVDPLMVRYMKMIQDQKEKVESLPEQTPKKEDTEPSEESFVIEAGERLDTPSDFGW